MLRIVSHTNYMHIMINNQIVFVLTPEKSFLRVGKGLTSYKRNANYDYNENLGFQAEMYCTETIEKDGAYELLFTSQDQTIQLTMNLSYHNERLNITFKCFQPDINRIWLDFVSVSNSSVFGGGKLYDRLNLDGQMLDVFIGKTELVTPKFLSKKVHFQEYRTNYMQPTFLLDNKTFVNINTFDRCIFDFRKKEVKTVCIHGIPSEIIVCAQNNYINLLENLTSSVGRQMPLPEWVYEGALIDMEGGQEAIVDEINVLLENEIRVAGIVLKDWTAIDKFTWDINTEVYPDLVKFCNELVLNNIRVLGTFSPYIGVKSRLFAQTEHTGIYVKKENGDNYLAHYKGTLVAILDLTNPKTVNFIKVHLKNTLQWNIHGWVVDGGNSLPIDAMLHNGKKSEEFHNQWPSLIAKLCREVLQEAGRLEDCFFMMQSGHNQCTEYNPLVWNEVTRYDFNLPDGYKGIVPSILSLAMVGVGAVHSSYNTAATYGHRHIELIKRSHEISAFSIIMHIGSSKKEKKAKVNNEYLAHLRQMVDAHYIISEYIKSYVMENHLFGKPIIRPIFYEDEILLKQEIINQYLLGDDLMVAPVEKQGTSYQEVCIPNNAVWINIWSNVEYTSGSHMIDAPLGRIPVFYRKGSKFEYLFKRLNNLVKNGN